MIKHLLLICTLFTLSGCLLAKQNETYTHDDICSGIKRKLIYAKINPNITGDTIKEPPAKLRQMYIENNCGENDDL